MANSFHLGTDNVYRVPVLDEIPWLEHGFGTRLASGWLLERKLTTAHQVHSGIVLVAAGEGVVGDGDALISDQREIMLAVRTADCLPVLIVDPRQRAIAAVHAGWRGTIAGISAQAVEEMVQRYHSNPRDLIAAIGPGIGSCCFEVGPEVGRQFQTYLPGREDLSGRAHIDLAEVNHRMLKNAGLRDQNVVCADLCTCCNGERFESFRRDREASGRMLSGIGIRAK